jgi:hypothetical protein
MVDNYTKRGNGMNEIELKCQELYEQGGQYEVYAYVMANHKGIDWNECIPCEAWSPISNGACLVCATEVYANA